uniref:Uncharacterized protein n=1 Tax=Anguilla anguilla TaxID=7936 RepID=A0A0E9VHP4_ANGAN
MVLESRLMTVFMTEVCLCGLR